MIAVCSSFEKGGLAKHRVRRHFCGKNKRLLKHFQEPYVKNTRTSFRENLILTQENALTILNHYDNKIYSLEIDMYRLVIKSLDKIKLIVYPAFLKSSSSAILRIQMHMS